MSRTKGLIGNILVFGAGPFLAKLVQFLLLPLYTYYLSSDAYAEGELLNNFVDLVYPLVTLCIFEAVFRFSLSSNIAKSDIIVSAALVSGILLGASGIVCFGLSIVTHSGRSLLFFVLLLGYSLRQFLAFYARGAGFVIPFAISGVINAASLAVFSYCLIVSFDLSSNGYILALALSHLASATYLVFAAKIPGTLFPAIKGKLSIDRELCKSMLKYSVPLVGFNLSFWFSTMSSRYILAFLAGASVAGLYLAVIKLSAVINMIQQVFYYAFQINASAEYEKKGDLAYLSKVYWAFSCLLIVIASMLMCVMPAIGSLVLQGEFASASKYLPLALYAAFIDCLFCFFKSFYTAYKKTIRSALGTAVGAVVNVGVCFLLIPDIGIWGALLALFISNVVMSAVRAIDTRSFVPIDQRWRSNAVPILLIGIQVLSLSLEMAQSAEICIIACLASMAYLSISYRKEIGRLILLSRENLK